MTATTLEELIGGTVTIPTVPTTLNEINRILEDPEGSAPEAAEVIVKDQAIATKVLRLANSPLYGLRNPISNIPHAVSILGLKTLRNLVVQATILDQFRNNDPKGRFDAAWLWDHSVKTGQCARTLARRFPKEFGIDHEEAYTAGLLHDIGMILLLENTGDRFQEALERSSKECRPLHLVESEIFGYHHGQVGGFLAKSWKLGPRLESAINDHHSEPSDEEAWKNGRILKLANGIAHRVSGKDPGYQGDPIEEEWLHFLDHEEENGIQSLLDEIAAVGIEEE